MTEYETIRAEVAAVIDDAVRLRRELHRVPEGGFVETVTARIIARELAAMGLEAQTGLAETGLTATITGALPGPVVALRADMDGLAVTETTGKPYSSHRDGFAHCCGHDGHMAALVGAARVLTALRDRLAGSVQLLFQPAEETGSGAKAMLDAGIFNGRPPAAVFALHSWPGLPVGVVTARPGPMASACDEFEITVCGQGGHGARPEKACTPIIPAARIIEAISALTGPPEGPVPRVVSVGRIRAGQRVNVIPEAATFGGTIRSGDAGVRRELHQQVRHTALTVAREASVRVEVEIHTYCPPLNNDPDLYATFVEVADGLLGPAGRTVLDRPSAGAEDFGYYLEHAPGLLFRLGVGADCAELHNPAFDFDDAALPAGIGVLAGLALATCRPPQAPDERTGA